MHVHGLLLFTRLKQLSFFLRHTCICASYLVRDLPTAPFFVLISISTKSNPAICTVLTSLCKPLALSRWPHFRKLSPLLLSESQTGPHKHAHMHTQEPVLFNPRRPVLIYGKGGSSRHWFQFTVPRLTTQLPPASHHPSEGAGAEDDTQPGHSMTPRLCFLSNTPPRSLSNTTAFLCLIA